MEKPDLLPFELSAARWQGAFGWGGSIRADQQEGERMARKPGSIEVSPNNPCPFLRALVAQGLVADDVASVGEVTRVIMDVTRAGDGEPRLPAAAIRAIALIANGLGPLQFARNGLHGLRLNELRNGPLDKKGAGSGILDASARINDAELARLDEFASEKTDAEGRKERGLDLAELQRMMDANFERAAGRRRKIDRRLMDGEWPILLKVMGKEGKSGRYLCVKEVSDLFVERRLPQRMAGRPIDR
ncbi:MAG TPA: hypothetical protein VF169_14785 [Albitalea sp.]|uniref:hypothetical protein n=1 Tax=Piscinibacter sp. TaxID=1903157 RepID=UPI002ED69C05